MLYSLWIFFLLKKKCNCSCNLCFFLTKLHFKKLPFLTKTLVEKFTARCTYPGYKQSSLILLLFCQWHFAIPLCATWFDMSLCATLCVAFEFRCQGEARQKEKATSLRLVTTAGPERALGWAEPYSFLLTKWTLNGCFGFGKRKSLECVREKALGIWASARVIVEVSCGSPVSVFTWLFPVVQE